jgi:hypothetical protein
VEQALAAAAVLEVAVVMLGVIFIKIAAVAV